MDCFSPHSDPNTLAFVYLESCDGPDASLAESSLYTTGENRDTNQVGTPNSNPTTDDEWSTRSGRLTDDNNMMVQLQTSRTGEIIGVSLAVRRGTTLGFGLGVSTGVDYDDIGYTSTEDAPPRSYLDDDTVDNVDMTAMETSGLQALGLGSIAISLDGDLDFETELYHDEGHSSYDNRSTLLTESGVRKHDAVASVTHTRFEDVWTRYTNSNRGNRTMVGGVWSLRSKSPGKAFRRNKIALIAMLVSICTVLLVAFLATVPRKKEGEGSSRENSQVAVATRKPAAQPTVAPTIGKGKLGTPQFTLLPQLTTGTPSQTQQHTTDPGMVLVTPFPHPALHDNASPTNFPERIPTGRPSTRTIFHRGTLSPFVVATFPLSLFPTRLPSMHTSLQNTPVLIATTGPSLLPTEQHFLQATPTTQVPSDRPVAMTTPPSVLPSKPMTSNSSISVLLTDTPSKVKSFPPRTTKAPSVGSSSRLPTTIPSADLVQHSIIVSLGPTKGFAPRTSRPTAKPTLVPTLVPTYKATQLSSKSAIPTSLVSAAAFQRAPERTRNPFPMQVAPTRSPVLGHVTFRPTVPLPAPVAPTRSPVIDPATFRPTVVPTASPTQSPSRIRQGMVKRTQSPTKAFPTSRPVSLTASPTILSPPPSSVPTMVPAATPTGDPTHSPSGHPTLLPTDIPTASPTEGSTHSWTPTSILSDMQTTPPTNVPTSCSPELLDTNGTFPINIFIPSVQVDCKWLQGRPAFRYRFCKSGGQGYIHCQATCNNC